jgi:hypothetical protein
LFHGPEHVLRRAKAVHTYDVGSGVKQGLGGGGSICSLGGFIFVFEADGDHDGESGFLGALDAEERLA